MLEEIVTFNTELNIKTIYEQIIKHLSINRIKAFIKAYPTIKSAAKITSKKLELSHIDEARQAMIQLYTKDEQLAKAIINVWKTDIKDIEVVFNKAYNEDKLDEWVKTLNKEDMFKVVTLLWMHEDESLNYKGDILLAQIETDIPIDLTIPTVDSIKKENKELLGGLLNTSLSECLTLLTMFKREKQQFAEILDYRDEKIEALENQIETLQKQASEDYKLKKELQLIMTKLVELKSIVSKDVKGVEKTIGQLENALSTSSKEIIDCIQGNNQNKELVAAIDNAVSKKVSKLENNIKNSVESQMGKFQKALTQQVTQSVETLTQQVAQSVETYMSEQLPNIVTSVVKEVMESQKAVWRKERTLPEQKNTYKPTPSLETSKVAVQEKPKGVNTKSVKVTPTIKEPENHISNAVSQDVEDLFNGLLGKN